MSMTETTTRGADKSETKSPSEKNQNMLPMIPPGAGGIITDPTSSDVLSGRGGKINAHDGNVRFRELISENKVKYLSESTKKLDKAHIAAKIVSSIRNLDPPGRFLKVVDSKKGTWTEIGDEKARKKAGQALREDGPDIRNTITKENEKKKQEEDTMKMMMSHSQYFGYPGHAGHQIHMVPPGPFFPSPGVPYSHQVPPHAFYPGSVYPYGNPYPQMHQDPSLPQQAPDPNVQQQPNYYPMPHPPNTESQPQVNMSNPQVALPYQTPQNPTVSATYTNIQRTPLNQSKVSTEKQSLRSRKGASSNDSSSDDFSTFDSETLKALTGDSTRSFASDAKMEKNKSNVTNSNKENNTIERAIHNQSGWLQNNKTQTSFASLRSPSEQNQIIEPTHWENKEKYRDRNNEDDEDDENNVSQEEQNTMDMNSVDMSWSAGMDPKTELQYYQQISSSQQTLQTSGADPSMWASGNMNQQEYEADPQSQSKILHTGSVTSDTSDIRAEWRQQMQEAKASLEKRNQMIAEAMELVNGHDQRLTGISEENALLHDKMDDMRSIDSNSYSEFMSIGSATMARLANGEDSTMSQSLESQSAKKNMYRRDAMMAMSGKQLPGGYPNNINQKSTRSLISNITNDFANEGSENGSTWLGSSRSILSDLTSLSLDFQGDGSLASRSRRLRVQQRTSQQIPLEGNDSQQR